MAFPYSFEKILVIKLRALGDTVLMTAPLLKLTQAFPYSQIHVLARKEWLPILEGFPGITRLWPYERREAKIARARVLAKVGFALRKERFDCVVNLHASPSSSTLALATGASFRSIHFHGHHDSNRYATVHIPGKGILKPIIERDMDTVRAIGVNSDEGTLPQIFLRPEERQAAQEHLRSLGLVSPILALSLGASRPSKSWPISSFGETALKWCQETGGSVLVLTGPGEDHLRREFQNHTFPESIRKRISIPDPFPIRKLAGILSEVSVVAGNDSGPRHLAVAVRTPTVTLFGPEDPFEWHPYPKDLHPYFFIEELNCRKDHDPRMKPWCGMSSCTLPSAENHRCLKGIFPEDVLTACKKLIQPRN